MAARFARLAEMERSPITIHVDGVKVEALQGDTLMVALLMAQGHLRQSEFGGEKRAGFCLMGACQDCWVWTDGGGRIRACTTLAEEGMRIFTMQPEATWPNHA